MSDDAAKRKVWLSQIDQASMQAAAAGAPKSYPYSRLLDEQRQAMVEAALATMSNQLADANRSLHLWRQVALAHGLQMDGLPKGRYHSFSGDEPHDRCSKCGVLVGDVFDGKAPTGCLMSDPPTSDPDASPNRSIVDQTIDALDKRLVGRTDRTRLRGALDKADAPLTGKDAANEAIGRIARLGVLQGQR